jgi:hypothetical protein
MGDKSSIKKIVIFISFLYLFIGLGFLIGGASTDSRFYVIDDLLVRMNGLILTVSCIGIFFRKDIARKGLIMALILSLIEIFIGIPQNTSIRDLVTQIIIMLWLYVPGLIFFINPKQKNTSAKSIKNHHKNSIILHH